MKKLLRAFLLITAAGATAYAGFPDAATADRLFLQEIGAPYGEPEGVTTSPFVEGETVDQALAAARVAYGYYAEVYLALFVREGGRWRVADFDGPFNYMPEIGGDEGTVAKAKPGPRTYYVFTCTEASYGSGMGTEYDYFILYRVADEKLVKAFEGETGSREDYYARWYGGDDSSAWEYGGYVEGTTEFTFDDVDGDGTSELWALTREAAGKDGPATYVTADLYAVSDDGNFASVDTSLYYDVLAATETLAAKLLLARAALAEAGDVAGASAFLEEAATLEPSAAPGIEKRLEFLERLTDDPPEAVRLYYRDGSDVHRALIEQYPESAAAAEATILVGTFDELTAFLKKRRGHPRWRDAYAYAVREALYDINYEEDNGLNKKDIKQLKKYLGRYVKLTTGAEERSRTMTHLGDCYYHLGDVKTARRLYRDSLAAAPHGVFEGYDYLRLGDCAAASADHARAIEYYMNCANLDDWWSGEAADALVGYAAVREGTKWRHFLDYLDERGAYDYLTLEAGDLDGKDGADLVALVPWDEEPSELYYFMRSGDEFRGEMLTAGRPSLWFPKIEYVFEGPPQVLSCRETAEDIEGRVTYEVLYRYDGSSMREVARVKAEETSAAAPDYEYEATLTFVDAVRPAFAVDGTVRSAEGETTFTEEYVWDEDKFAFVRVE
jgi:tetratricopeptide (TPR) repeat protein